MASAESPPVILSDRRERRISLATEGSEESLWRPKGAKNLVSISEPSRRVALYVHVPFCRARCAYCDFNTYAGVEDLVPAYVAAVCREIKAAGQRWGRVTVPTIYLGGGTPSILPLDLVAEVFRVIRLTFQVSRDAEVTLEANPGTVTPMYLRGLRELGVNRLSLGIQSAHDDELGLLGRIHTWEQAVETVGTARATGFDNLNLDFIFGLPGQTLARWRGTLEAALALGPSHLSLYCLSVEEGTPLERRIAGGQVPPPDDDRAAEMYALAEGLLAEAGFFHYEISNWARADLESQSPDPQPHVSGPWSHRWWPGSETCGQEPERASEEISACVCQHNLAYWRNEPWLGVGAGAHSWLDGRRWANVCHPREYIAALQQGGAPVGETETIGRRLEMGETMMLGLRLAEGVSDARFRARFGVGVESVFEGPLVQLQALGLLEWDGCVACLTARGRLLGNQVFVQFV